MREHFHKGEPLWGSSETSYSARLKKNSLKKEIEEDALSSQTSELKNESDVNDVDLLLLWNFYANVDSV